MFSKLRCSLRTNPFGYHDNLMHDVNFFRLGKLTKAEEGV